MSTTVILLSQLAVVITVIVVYTVLTVTGFDGTPVLTILAGQGIGAGIQFAGQRGGP